MIGRVELQIDIVYFKLANTNISFPRNKINEACSKHFRLPSDEKINNTMQNALRNALNDAANFGMIFNINDIRYCELGNSSTDLDDNQIEFSDDDDVNIDSSTPSSPNRSFDENLFEQQNATEKNKFVDIPDGCGSKKSIRKSTYVWMLSGSVDGLSTDRLKRVKSCKAKTKRQLKFDKPIASNDFTLQRNDHIQIGNWCIFKFDDKNIAIGCVVSFKYIQGKKEKDKMYTWDFVPTTIEGDHGNVEQKRGIEVLASWNVFDSIGKLKPLQEINCFYINIENYITTMTNPLFDFDEEKNIFIKRSYFQNMKLELLNYIDLL